MDQNHFTTDTLRKKGSFAFEERVIIKRVSATSNRIGHSP